MKVASLTTRRIDPSLALAELLEQFEALDFEPKGAVLLTAMMDEPAPLVRGLYDAMRLPMIGTKTTGVGSQDSRDVYDTAVLVVFGGEDCTVRTARLANISGDSALVASDAAALNAGKVCIAFLDAMSASTDRAIRAIKEVVGNAVVCGGFSADDWTFDNVQQFHDGEVLTDAAPFMVIAGDFCFGVASAMGITPITTVRSPVEIEGRSILKIGDKRAYDFYIEQVGDPRLFGEFPIMFEDGGRERCRAPLSPDAVTGVVHCGADIPASARVVLGNGTRPELVDAATDATLQALRACPGRRPVFAFVVSCAARRRRLGLQADEERMAIASAMQTPFALCYLYGEVAPSEAGDVALENNNIVVLTIGQEA